MQIKQNEPYTVVTEVDVTKQQFFVVVKRIIMSESDTFQDTLTDMIRLCFIMDTTYPTGLYVSSVIKHPEVYAWY